MKIGFMRRSTALTVAASLALGMALGISTAAQADHQWSSYHWERDGIDPLIITVADNHVAVDANLPEWELILKSVVAGWASGADGGYGGLHFGTIDSSGSLDGNVPSFNDNYGDTGWLGIASIWVTRGKNKHITRGQSKVNDFYVTLAGYDGFDQIEEWRAVLCQEIGHTLGLAHTAVDYTCMNTEDRPLRYETPNAHDTEMLDAMYAEDHGSDGGGGGGGPCKKKKNKFCAGAIGVSRATWAEHYDSEEAMFDAADAVVDVTVMSSAFSGLIGRSQGAVPVTRVVLRVEDTLSGFTRPVIVLEQTRGPSLEIIDDPGYVQGDSYTLYLRQIDNNTYRTVNPSGRIRN
ncbi:MAG: hypothetical protein IID51_07670 [Proteobacteria bacterium]|nr:hypothetical protein [Pseudomonadota bacterium]